MNSTYGEYRSSPLSQCGSHRAHVGVSRGVQSLPKGSKPIVYETSATLASWLGRHILALPCRSIGQGFPVGFL